MTPQETQSALEAIIYAADEPATLDQMARALGLEKPEVSAALELLVASYQTDDRGVEIRKVAGGWKFYTKAQHHDAVRRQRAFRICLARGKRSPRLARV
jgi:segregation and condensation protein B